MFKRILVFVLLLGFSICCFAVAQDFSQIEIKTIKLTDNLYVLFGAGGNIAVSVGDDGVVMIDDQYAPLSEKIGNAVKQISEKPIGYILNTHWHGDHTGGNEQFGNSGAVLVAHENVRKRLSEGQFMAFFNRQVPPAPKGALPVITFTRDLKFHLNGETISVVHVDPAHTDGDSIVFFKQANTIHMGDVFFNGNYPFIDLGSGGSIDGVIKAVAKGLKKAHMDTRIIPGHGPLADVVDLMGYRDRRQIVRDKVWTLKQKGASLEEVLAAKPSAKFDEAYGGGFIKPEKFVESIYQSL